MMIQSSRSKCLLKILRSTKKMNVFAFDKLFKSQCHGFFYILCWHLEKMQITCRFSKWWAATISREKTHRSLCVANYYRSHTFFDRSKMTCRMCVCVCSFFFQWVPFFIYLLCLVSEMFFLLFYGWFFFCWYFLPFIEKTLFCDSQVF